MNKDTKDPSRLYAEPGATGTKLGGPVRNVAERRQRAQAIDSLTLGQPVVYAVRLPDGIIKIGCSRSLSARIKQYPDPEVLGFMFGDFDVEQSFHVRLRPHRARGHEYYHPTPEVFAAVNEIRDHFGLPHIAA